jgi:hypothetical protein
MPKWFTKEEGHVLAHRRAGKSVIWGESEGPRFGWLFHSNENLSLSIYSTSRAGRVESGPIFSGNHCYLHSPGGKIGFQEVYRV